MRECPDIAKVEIRRLRAKGIEPSLDQIVWLASLAERVTKPERLGNPLLAAVPVVAGSEPFYELTNHACWWIDIAHDWFSGLSICHMLGYAHRYSRVPRHFEALCTEDSAREAVSKWRDGVSLTDAEILDAVSRWTNNDEPDDPREQDQDEETDGESTAGQTMALALAVSGITRAEFEAMTPAESSEIVKQAIIFGTDSSQVGTRNAADASARAMQKLTWAINEIQQAHERGK